jgi:hypothetical protein
VPGHVAQHLALALRLRGSSATDATTTTDAAAATTITTTTFGSVHVVRRQPLYVAQREERVGASALQAPHAHSAVISRGEGVP